MSSMPWVDDLQNELTQVIAERDALQAELEQLKNPWISVEDELPENHNLVVCYGFTGENDNNPHEKDYDLGALNSEGCTIVMYGFCNGHVIKWMPLPKLEGKGDE